jgi:hypothetical protein
MAALPQTLPTVEKPARWQPAKMSWWYHAIIDFMIANPQATKKDMAARFKCSEMAIGLITNSDIFRAHFAARRKEFSEGLDATLHQELGKIAIKSLGIMSAVLEKKGDAIPLMQLAEISDKVLDRLGYGIQAEAPTPAPSGTVNVFTAPVQNNNTSVTVPVTAADLEAARQALRRSESMKTIDSQPLSGELERTLLEDRGEPLGRVLSPPALDGAAEETIGEVRGPDEPAL